MRVLLALDPHTYNAMMEGRPPRVPYSHDRNLTMLGHEALALGHEVYVSSGIHGIWHEPLRRITQILPYWSYEATELDTTTCDCVVSAGIEQLRIRTAFPRAKIVGVLPALHMFESPSLHGPKYVYNFLSALREDVDFVITLNQRMRETLLMLAAWLSRIDISDRVLVAPLGFSESQFDLSESLSDLRREAREMMQLGNDDVLLVNAGGAWGWTDNDTFIDALCRYSVLRKHNIRVYFSGIVQPDNLDKNEVAENLAKLERDYAQFFAQTASEGNIIYIEKDWAKGGREVGRILQAADAGIHLNKDTFEAWQSHRVRFVDYLAHRLPVLSTRGDLTSELNSEACFFCKAKDIDSYFGVFDELSGNLDALRARKRAAAKARRKYNTATVLRPIWDHIESTPLRESSLMEDWFFDVFRGEEAVRLSEELSFRINDFLSPGN
jgi:hypothetical protein